MSGREADSSTGTCVVAGIYRHQGSRSAMLRHAQVGALVGDHFGAFLLRRPRRRRAGMPRSLTWTAQEPRLTCR